MNRIGEWMEQWDGETEEPNLLKAKSISLTPEDWNWVTQRVEELKPNVSSVSSYFRQLLNKDRLDSKNENKS